MNTLLEDIKLSIKQTGGRIKLAYLIMKENPAYFSHAEKMNINNRLSKQIHWDTHHKIQRPHIGAWFSEDDEYLLKHWGKKESKVVAKAVNRTVIACNRRMKKLLTPEEYKERVRTGRYAHLINSTFKQSA